MKEAIIDTAKLTLLLHELRLPATKLIWAQFAQQADKEGWPAARFLTALCEHELAERDQRRIERHLAEARLLPGRPVGVGVGLGVAVGTGRGAGLRERSCAGAEQTCGVERVIGEDAAAPGTLERHQRFQHQRIAVGCAHGGGGLDHRVFAAHLIGEDRHIEALFHAVDDVEIGEARLHHHRVGALGNVQSNLAHRLVGIGRVHLIGVLVAFTQVAR